MLQRFPANQDMDANKVACCRCLPLQSIIVFASGLRYRALEDVTLWSVLID